MIALDGLLMAIVLVLYLCCFVFFFFQAEDGIRDLYVTGVQTCALPIWAGGRKSGAVPLGASLAAAYDVVVARGPQGGPRASSSAVARATASRPSPREEIGRASCRGKSVDLGGRRVIKEK